MRPITPQEAAIASEHPNLLIYKGKTQEQYDSDRKRWDHALDCYNEGEVVIQALKNLADIYGKEKIK